MREQGLMIRHTRTDVGRELPPIIRIPHRIDSDSAALDAVESSAAELAKIILTQNPLERGEKWHAAEELTVMLRQATGIAKAPYVADFVRLLLESETRVILFGWHREVYTIWQSKLKDFHPVMFTGSETPTEKTAAIRQFTHGSARVLIMSLRAGAGVDGLQDVCSVGVFGELDWSPGVHEQCIGRIFRDGQQGSVAAYFLVAEDGSDPAVADTLGLKREQVEGLRNPDADALEALETSGDHTRRLAERYLTQIGEALPVPSPAQEVA
jgi:superfamily II DNA or RNA helicase